mgnify:CR=1 FL=1
MKLDTVIPIRHRGPLPARIYQFNRNTGRVILLDDDGKPLPVVEPPLMRIPRGGHTGISKSAHGTRRQVTLETWWLWRGRILRHRQVTRYGPAFTQPAGTWDGFGIQARTPGPEHQTNNTWLPVENG